MKPDDVQSYDDLAKQTTPRLRELAQQDTDLVGATGLEKPVLLEALAKAYGLEVPRKGETGRIKKLKKQMKQAKKERDEIMNATPAERDRRKLKHVRREIRLLKRQMRRLARAS